MGELKIKCLNWRETDSVENSREIRTMWLMQHKCGNMEFFSIRQRSDGIHLFKNFIKYHQDRTIYKVLL